MWSLVSFLPNIQKGATLSDRVINKDYLENSQVINKSIDNLRAISTVNDSRGIKTFFVPQIMNVSELSLDQNTSAWMPNIKDADVVKIIKFYNEKLKEVSEQESAIFVNVNQDNYTQEDFVDEGHFSTLGSIKFSNELIRTIKQHCALETL